MFSEEELERILQNKETNFDVSLPSEGYKDRFKAKQYIAEKARRKKRFKVLMSRAAVFVLLLSLGYLFMQNFKEENIDQPNEKEEIVSLPEEVKNAQSYFETMVQRELVKLERERSPETEAIINAAFAQISFLEEEQRKIQGEVLKNYDKRLVKALIDNFHYRIQLLESVMKQIELTKEIKSKEHEII